jgi:hypothetical protein
MTSNAILTVSSLDFLGSVPYPTLDDVITSILEIQANNIANHPQDIATTFTPFELVNGGFCLAFFFVNSGLRKSINGSRINCRQELTAGQWIDMLTATYKALIAQSSKGQQVIAHFTQEGGLNSFPAAAAISIRMTVVPN